MSIMAILIKALYSHIGSDAGFCFSSPRFGIAHALCLGLAPWLAAEIPILVDSGMIKHKDDASSSIES